MSSQAHGIQLSVWRSEAFAESSRRSLAFWWLGLRRNGGIWLVPLIALAVGWLVKTAQLRDGLVFWSFTVDGIGFALAVVGPLVAAYACWVAARDQRRGLEDLLTTAPAPRRWSTALDWLAAATWSVGAYIFAAGAALLWTGSRATWGEPVLAPVVIASIAVLLCSLIGYIAGTVSVNRLLPPVMAIAVAFMIVGPIGMPRLESVKLLSPIGPLKVMELSDFEVTDERMVAPHLCWLAALGVTLLGILLLRGGVRWSARALTVTGVVLMLITGTALVNNASLRQRGYHAPLPYVPVCETHTVTVCVHPAYRPFLGRASRGIERLLVPLAGINGVPVRFEQVVGMAPDDPATVTFQIWDKDGFRGMVPTLSAAGLVGLRVPAGPDGTRNPANLPRVVVGSWLLMEAGFGNGTEQQFGFFVYGVGPDQATGARELRAKVDAAIARFAALDPAIRHQWLVTNFAALRAGALTLDDLP